MTLQTRDYLPLTVLINYSFPDHDDLWVDFVPGITLVKTSYSH